VEDNLSELESFNLKNWVVLVIENNIANPILEPFANLCIDKNVLYMHATGKDCSEVDDLFDILMILREEKGAKPPHWMTSENDVLMTSWDYNFEKAFWFITMAANYENYKIDTVLVANLTNHDYLEELQILAKKISSE
jgi:hypothetical protein